MLKNILNILLLKWDSKLLSETDKKFVLGASLSLLLLFVLLYFNYQAPDDVAGSKQIGILLIKRNIVQRKPETRVSWRSVQESYPVYEKDTVRTGEQSAAVLHLNGKFKIDMDENTTIVLDFLDTSKKGRVRLGSGSVRFRQADPKDPKILNLEVVDKDESFNLSGAGELLLNRSKPNEKLKLAALSNQVKLTGTGGIEETLTPDSFLVLSEKKISKERFTVLPKKPEDGAYIAGFSNSIPVKFSWTTGGKKAQRVQIEISKESNFSKILFKKKTLSSSLSRKLKPGVYYWRLLGPPSKNLSGKYSVTRKFRVISQAAVLTYKPPARELFVYRSIEPFINFSWSDVPNADSYTLEISKNRNFKKTVVKKRTSSTSYGAAITAGKYYWRVTVKNSLTGSSLISKVKTFKVERKDTKLAVRLKLAPKPILDKKVLEKKGFVVSWEDSPEIAYSDIIIAEDPKMSDVIIKKRVSTNFVRIKEKFNKPTYHYQIKSYNQQEELLSELPTHTFRVKGLKDSVLDTYATIEKNIKIEKEDIQIKKQNLDIHIKRLRLLSPDSNSSFDRDIILYQGIRFAWRRLNIGENFLTFRLFVAKDRAFKKILFKKDTKKGHIISRDIKANGRYFWKVMAINTKNNSILGETKPFFFTVLQLPAINIDGIGIVRGRIISRGESSVTISTSKGRIKTTIDKIIDVQY